MPSLPVSRVASILLLVALVYVGLLSVAWLRADAFIDREEAGHVQRAFQTYDRLQASQNARQAARDLVLLRVTEDAKPWYGFPYYLTVAVVWAFTSPSYDSAALTHLVWLLVSVGATYLVALKVTERRHDAAALGAILLLLLPGTLLWVHLFSPTLFILAGIAAVAALTVYGDLFRRPLFSLAAGLVLAAVSITKLTAFVYWIPILPYCVVYATRPLFSKHRVLGTALFGIGFLPAAAHVVVNREALRFWDTQLRALWAAPSVSAAVRDAALRWVEIAGPILITILFLGAAASLLRTQTRGRGLLLLFWAVMPSLLIPITSAQSGSSRDHLPAFIALCAAAALGYGSLLKGKTWLGALIVASFGMIAGAVLMFDVLPWLAREPVRTKLFRRLPSGVFRLSPFPDLIGELVRRIPPVAETPRCRCLGALPYPIRNEPSRPVLGLDSLLVGPENLEVWHRLAGRALPWHIGIVPYPLPCPAYRTAMDCLSIVVSDNGPGAGYPMTEGIASERRKDLQKWGELVSVYSTRSHGTFWVRVSRAGSLCTMTPATNRLDWYRATIDSCPDGGYYADYLRLAVGPAELTTASSLHRVRSLAESRLLQLQRGEDAPSLVFGEEFLVRSTLSEIDQRERLLAIAP